MNDFTGPLILSEEFPLDPQALLIPLADWISANLHDAECMEAVPALLAGETVAFGGGAFAYAEVRLIPEPDGLMRVDLHCRRSDTLKTWTYNGFQLFTIRANIEDINKHIPASVEYWISPA